MPKPIPGVGRPAHLLDETVVATAAADRVLRGVEHVALELERRTRVVVEAAHQPRRDLEVDPEHAQPGLHRLEVGRGGVGEVVADLRRGVDHVLPVVTLRVEDPQRVRLGALDVGAEQRRVLAPVPRAGLRDTAHASPRRPSS